MRVASLHTYPVKGCYRTDHREVVVEPWGPAGDRRWVIVDANGAMVTQRQIPDLVRIKPRAYGESLHLRADGHPDLSIDCEPGDVVDMLVFSDPVRATPVGEAADAWLSAVLDHKVRLLWLDDPTRRGVRPEWSRPTDRVSLADEFPLLITNMASLTWLNDALLESDSDEGPLPMTRFRPNVVAEGAAAWAEDSWLGRRMRIGDAVFRVVKGHGRCVVTTTDQDTGARGREPLRTLGRFRNVDQSLLFGVVLIPDTVGVITVGDDIVIE
jgi:MOSC domain-containing protein